MANLGYWSNWRPVFQIEPPLMVGSSWMLLVGLSFVKRDGTKPFLTRRGKYANMKIIDGSKTITSLLVASLLHYTRHEQF